MRRIKRIIVEFLDGEQAEWVGAGNVTLHNTIQPGASGKVQDERPLRFVQVVLVPEVGS